MSFTQNIKAQLVHTENSCNSCDIWELASLLKLCTAYSGGAVTVSTENEDVADRVRYLHRRIFKSDADFINKNGVFRYFPDVDFFMEEMAEKLKLSVPSIPVDAMSECCLCAYVRGSFFGGGSVSEPTKRYHMEFDTKHEGYANQLMLVLTKLGIPSKITCRKGRYIVYIKEYEAIADTLGAIGAFGASMDFYNVSIEKELRNAANRRLNCDMANIEKATKSAAAQLEAIKKIKKYNCFDKLPEVLREIADLRCAYPEESLTELGKRLSPPLGKSGVNHRLKRIEKIAEEL